MKFFGSQDNQTSRACYGIHLIFTCLLAIGLAAYDGLEHTYPILIVYMFAGWLIPFAISPLVTRMIARPVGSVRSGANKYGPWIVLTVLGIVVFLLGIFLPTSWINTIKINGEIIPQSDPRFAHAYLMSRIAFIGMGLLFAVGGYFVFRSKRLK